MRYRFLALSAELKTGRLFSFSRVGSFNGKQARLPFPANQGEPVPGTIEMPEEPVAGIGSE